MKAIVLSVTMLLVLLSACAPTLAAETQPSPAASPSLTSTPALSGVEGPDLIIAIGAPTEGSIHPLLGVNVGPIPAGADNADLTAAYRRTSAARGARERSDRAERVG